MRVKYTTIDEQGGCPMKNKTIKSLSLAILIAASMQASGCYNYGPPYGELLVTGAVVNGGFFIEGIEVCLHVNVMDGGSYTVDCDYSDLYTGVYEIFGSSSDAQRIAMYGGYVSSMDFDEYFWDTTTNFPPQPAPIAANVNLVFHN